jgi:hypothetical protein
MLTSIISQYLRPSENDLDAKVLNLELLAYNFHDSLDLRPLFFDLRRRVGRSSLADRKDLLERIRGVAKEITAKQLFALEGHGKSFRRSIDMEELKAAKGGLQLEGETVTVRDVTCQVDLRVLGVDIEQEQLRVRLEVKAPPDRPDLTDTRASFEASYFDFPMIDNTRLSNGLRCAVVLSNFSPEFADLITVCYPGEYASLKDRPYYDEVIQKLRLATEGVGVAPAPAPAPTPATEPAPAK